MKMQSTADLKAEESNRRKELCMVFMQETLNVANVSVTLRCYCTHTVALLSGGVAQPI